MNRNSRILRGLLMLAATAGMLASGCRAPQATDAVAGTGFAAGFQRLGKSLFGRIPVTSYRMNEQDEQSGPLAKQDLSGDTAVEHGTERSTAIPVSYQEQVSAREQTPGASGYEYPAAPPALPPRGAVPPYSPQSDMRQQRVDPHWPAAGQAFRGEHSMTPDPWFLADEMARGVPQSATERVIELNQEITALREEMGGLQQSIEKLQAENRELRGIRDQLTLRMDNLELQLERSTRNEEVARSQMELLSQRVQQFNTRRQNQIGDLNRIIDQLESQLRESETLETPVPRLDANPWRDSQGGGQ